MSKTSIYPIAIDAMGGDIGLDSTLTAVKNSLKTYPDLHLFIVGDEESIRKHPVFTEINQQSITLIHSSQIVEMDEVPTNVLRNKNDSSMWKSIELVKSGKALACVSAGNTGALMASARYILKMLTGISRPAICATLPTKKKHVHWLDLGANIESKPEQLEQFAIMGTELARAVDNNQSPKVGLLNVGEEAIKGSETIKEAGRLLSKAPINYLGFIEGDDIFLNDVDVVVCDGLVGNIALKTVEGLVKFIQLELTENYKRTLYTKIVSLFSFPILRALKNRFDPRLYNGATLLGLRGVVVKSHGNADAVAFENAIRLARLQVKNKVLEHITEQLQQIMTPDHKENNS